MELLAAMVLASIVVTILFTYFGGLNRIMSRIGIIVDNRTTTDWAMEIVVKRLDSIKELELLEQTRIQFRDCNYQSNKVSCRDGVLNVNGLDLETNDTVHLSFRQVRRNALTVQMRIGDGQPVVREVGLKPRVVRNAE